MKWISDLSVSDKTKYLLGDAAVAIRNPWNWVRFIGTLLIGWALGHFLR